MAASNLTWNSCSGTMVSKKVQESSKKVFKIRMGQDVSRFFMVPIYHEIFDEKSETTPIRCWGDSSRCRCLGPVEGFFNYQWPKIDQSIAIHSFEQRNLDEFGKNINFWDFFHPPNLKAKECDIAELSSNLERALQIHDPKKNKGCTFQSSAAAPSQLALLQVNLHIFSPESNPFFRTLTHCCDVTVPHGASNDSAILMSMFLQVCWGSSYSKYLTFGRTNGCRNLHAQLLPKFVCVWLAFVDVGLVLCCSWALLPPCLIYSNVIWFFLSSCSKTNPACVPFLHPATNDLLSS